MSNILHSYQNGSRDKFLLWSKNFGKRGNILQFSIITNNLGQTNGEIKLHFTDPDAEILGIHIMKSNNGKLNQHAMRSRLCQRKWRLKAVLILFTLTE